MQNAKSALRWYDERIIEFERKRQGNSGKLSRSDWWRLRYCENPYLLLESEIALQQHFVDVFSNSMYISREGKIAPYLPSEMGNGVDVEGFTHLMEAFGLRGGFTQGVLVEGNAVLSKYFDADGMRYVHSLKKYPLELRNGIAKFTKLEFAEDIVEYGRIRIAPASSYEKGSLLSAQRDLERRRDWFQSYVRETVEKGATSIIVYGINHPLKRGLFHGITHVADYYLFCASSSLSRRLPLDFNANAIVIIKDTQRFQKLLTEAVSRKIGGNASFHGRVEYFNSYVGWKQETPKQMTKHLRYKYQEEYRFVWKPKQKEQPLKPFFVEVGSMDDFVELVTL